MTPSLLIVTMGTDAVAPARMPYELSSAGFNVTLLAPRDALATHTAFVDKIGYFPPDVTLYQWVQAVAGAVRAVRPALILPGDDVAVRTLMQLALRPPEGLRSDVRDERRRGPPFARATGELDRFDRQVATLRRREARGRAHCRRRRRRA